MPAASRLHRFRAIPVALLATTLLALVAVPAPAADGGPRAIASIVGGKPTTITKFPWLVAVLDNGPEVRGDNAWLRQICGGTLIAPQVVLTAAHCVSNKDDSIVPATSLQIVTGRSVLDRRGGRIIDVDAIARHPLFKGKTLFYDVALLHLAAPVSGRVASLAPANFTLRETERATIVGWGLLHEGDIFGPTRLRATRVPLWSNERCKFAYEDDHEPGLMLCAAPRSGKRDVCNGDSGGPLIVRDATGVRRVVGVVSFGYGCALRGYPTNFAWAASPFLRGWIQRRMAGLQSASTDVVAPVISNLRRDGDAIRYALAEPAEVVFTFQQPGSDGEYTSLSTALVHQGRAGENGFRLPTSLRGRPIAPGAYRLRAVSTDDAGNLSEPAYLDVTYP